MSIKGLIADMDLDTIDLTEEDEISFQNTEKSRVNSEDIHFQKTENETKTESEVVELDSVADSAKELDRSSIEETGGGLVNEFESEVDWNLLKAESDQKEEKNEKLIENVNSCPNESSLNLNLEGKEDNNNFSVLGVDSNASTIENLELGLVLFNGGKDVKSEKMKDIDVNEDLVMDLDAKDEYGDCEGMVENKYAVSYANSEIEGEYEKTGLELVLVSDEGPEGNKNQEFDKIKGQNGKMGGVTDIVSMDLDLPLVSLKKEKRKKGRSENMKDKMDKNANLGSALVIYNDNENLNKRKRKKSMYLCSPFISTFKRLKMDTLFTGEDRRIVSIGEDGKIVLAGEKGSTKKDKFIENVLSDLISTAQNPCNLIIKRSAKSQSYRDFIEKFRESVAQKYIIHKEPTALLLKLSPQNIPPSKEDLIAKFTNFGVVIETEVLSENKSARVVFARRKDAESAFTSLNGSGEFENTRLRFPSPVVVAGPPPAVLSEVKEKLEEVMESLNESGLDLREDLVGDTKGLLQKVNFILSKDHNVYTKGFIEV